MRAAYHGQMVAPSPLLAHKEADRVQVQLTAHRSTGVVWSSEDAQRASTPTPDREPRCTVHKGGEARLRVFEAGSGTQDLSILGPLATPVYGGGAACRCSDRWINQTQAAQLAPASGIRPQRAPGVGLWRAEVWLQSGDIRTAGGGLCQYLCDVRVVPRVVVYDSCAVRHGTDLVTIVPPAHHL
eukprot:1195575-Prorocentrum_minimum.AAC.6